MPDLSFQQALDDPDGPFRRFVAQCVDLWNRAVVVYEQDGSPNGPAEDGDNVTRWMLHRIDQFDAVCAAEELLGFDKDE